MPLGQGTIGGGLAAAAVAVAAGVTVLLWQGGVVPPVKLPLAPPGAAPIPAARPDPQPQAQQAQPEPQADASAQAVLPAPPRFDVIRVEPDGRALIAGQAAPGWRLSVLLNGSQLAAPETGPDGRFAAFLDLGPSAEARVLSLQMTDPATGEALSAQGDVIVAPVAAPEPAPETPAPETPAETVAEASEEGAPVAAPETRSAPAQEAPAGSAPTVLLSDADGVRLLQGQAPKLQDSIALDAISYDDAGSVSLSGRGRPGAFARIYLDGRPAGAVQVDPKGDWRSDLPEVAAGVYTLRIDEVDAAGDVLSRVETPFQREAPQVAATAMAEAPATQVTVQKGNSLWAIARDRYGEGTLYVQVFRANRDLIRNPDLIYPGQIFTLPQVDPAPQP
ncbi:MULTISPECIES: LysM peptidoglycan-binding domain-containing protein [Pseudooceanicola]|uniref:LysM peptidoglycan-binding domain-containing protein n=1 Tax=Pseudooceanicola TaxID=1679449 RepID=UPI0028804A92|nr:MULTISPECIES: LysM peptidoglycan-binding domain-containing protein [Pseudooceanicola]